jgi:Tfp pilus assembly protein PilX
MKKISHNTKGFVSLFTVLMATVILAMAIGMSSVALKQIVLSSNASEANEAFYAADSALQCAIALDGLNTFQIGFEGFVDWRGYSGRQQ